METHFFFRFQARPRLVLGLPEARAEPVPGLFLALFWEKKAPKKKSRAARARGGSLYMVKYESQYLGAK